jgi:hypothetical protein
VSSTNIEPVEEEHMGREQMRNLETFKIGGSQVNEFEYQKNQGELTEQFDQHPDEAAKGKPRLTQAERVKQIMAAAHEKVEKRRKKGTAKSGQAKKSGGATRAAAKAAASAKAKKTRKPSAGPAKQARKK